MSTMIDNFKVFLLWMILVNISRAEILTDSIKKNTLPQGLDRVAATNFDEFSNFLELAESVTSKVPQQVETTTTTTATTTAALNKKETIVENVNHLENLNEATQTTETVVESVTNQIECVCDCIADGVEVTVGCTTQSPEESQTATTENSSNSENTSSAVVEEITTDSNNLGTTGKTNVEINTSTQSTTDSPTTTTASPVQFCNTPGVKPHESDCQKYYECSVLEGSQNGSYHLITKSCPEREAFNIELNRCSRDISSCKLDVQCTMKGNIADPVSNSSYYLCEPRIDGLGFRIFHVNCATHEIFYFFSRKCIADLDSLPFYVSNQPKDIDIVKAELKLLKHQDKLKLKQEKNNKKIEAKKAKEIEKANKAKAKQEAANFICDQEGNFASKFANNMFINCMKKKDKFKAISMQCNSGTTYFPEIGFCIVNASNVDSNSKSVDEDDDDDDDDD